MPTSRRIVDNEGEDFYPTPSWCTEALLACEKFDGDIWEPACGDGAISKVLEKTGCSIYSSDKYYRGYGDRTAIDFVQCSQALHADNIITNPPYNLAEDFVHIGLKKAHEKLALLLRLSFLESARRYNEIYKISQPSTVWVFSERITFYPNGLQTAGSGTLAYAWFIWDKTDRYNTTQLKWIPPYFKRPEGLGTIEGLEL